MGEGYLGEIRLWAPAFEPLNWRFCEGQTLPIQNNEALFSLLGVAYGGDMRTKFQLPDLREKDENGNPIPAITSLRNGKPVHIICVNGIYPQRY